MGEECLKKGLYDVSALFFVHFAFLIAALYPMEAPRPMREQVM
jgi:hypothetical protein